MHSVLKSVIALLLVAICSTPPLALAWPDPQQDGPEEAGEVETAEGADEELPDDEPEPADLISDAERVIRIENVIQLDQKKLEELRAELIESEALFQDTADNILAADESMAALDGELESLADDAPPEERSELESSRLRVENLSNTLREFSDLLFTAESSTRQQMQALEKKLVRERRTLNEIRGLTPPAEIESADASAVAPTTTAAAPSSGTSIPVMPGVSIPTGPSAAPPLSDHLETADQLEAQRALERAEADVVAAERALEEFVKRRESLLTQIKLEETLLETATKSRALLGSALEILEQEMAAGELADVVSDQLRVGPATIGRITRMTEDREAEIQRRADYLDSLERRLAALNDEELRVIAELDVERQEAAGALRHLLWLDSPLHPQNISRWFTHRGPRVLLVLAVSALLLFLVRLAARRTARAVMGTGRGSRAGRENRADTIGLSIQSVATLVIFVGGTLLVFQEAGVDIKTVLGGAAILGVAFAFGAQNMMRDYFSGFLILLEDQYGLGDLVTISGVTGRVETVNMRTTVLRDIEGRVHFIPNGDVKLVTNRTYEWGRAVLEIPVGYDEDVDRAMEVLVDVCKEMRTDPEWGEYLTEDPGMLGVDKFTEYGVVIKFMQATRPDKIFPVRRELLRRVKNRFDLEGIQIPVPQRMLRYPKGES